jgi:hypothetical protein
MLPALVLQLLERFGILEGLGDIANDQAANLLRRKFQRIAPRVVADLENDGFDYTTTTAARGTAPAAYVAGIIYRLMRESSDELPGVLVDQVRDRHAKRVQERVADRLTPETSHEAAVKMIADEFVNSLF